MPGLNSPAVGHSAQALGRVAENTLRDLLTMWLRESGASPPAILYPDSQRVDLVVHLPSAWGGVPDIFTYWQIKATTKRLSHVRAPGFSTNCLKYSVKRPQWDALREAARARDHFYIALAITDSSESPEELLQRPPASRFDWYFVDFAQQIRSPDHPGNAVFFPVQNKLTLSNFSLLWSSLWVESFYKPLTHPNVIAEPDLARLVSRIYTSRSQLDSTLLGDWNFLTDKLPRFEGKFEVDTFREVSFRLGLGQALGIINHRLEDAAGDLTEIRTYCPESLFGTVNLWLFSRSYQSFMSISAVVAPTSSGATNQRLLPLPTHPDEVSPMVRCALWHVILLYAFFGVEVRVIHRPKTDAGIDHSFYGGGIGYFPWISLADDGASWMIANNKEAVTGEHLDFINAHAANVYMSIPSHDFYAVAKALRLDFSEVLTASAAPEQLFPRDNQFIAHPYGIFGTQATKSITQLKRHLGRMNE